MFADSSVCGLGWLYVGTRGHWWLRLLVLWILEFWLRRSRRVDMSVEQVMTNLQQQLGAQQQALQQLQAMMESQQASAAQRENALQASSWQNYWIAWNRSTVESERTEVEHEVPKKHRAFIESRAFSKLTNFDSKAASWKDWAFKFETWPQL